MILGDQYGGVIPGGVASATPILLPSQPWPVVLTHLFFRVDVSGGTGWEGALEWLDGESNVLAEVFAQSALSGANDVLHTFFLGAWRPAQSLTQSNVPNEASGHGHAMWTLPRLVMRPGERARLRTTMTTPSEATLSSLRYRFERVSFRKD